MGSRCLFYLELILNHLELKNINRKDVNMAGHANIETILDTYTHATEKMTEQSVEIFEKVTKENLPTKKNFRWQINHGWQPVGNVNQKKNKPIPNKRYGLSLLKN